MSTAIISWRGLERKDLIISVEGESTDHGVKSCRSELWYILESVNFG